MSVTNDVAVQAWFLHQKATLFNSFLPESRTVSLQVTHDLQVQPPLLSELGQVLLQVPTDLHVQAKLSKNLDRFFFESQDSDKSSFKLQDHPSTRHAGAIGSSRCPTINYILLISLSPILALSPRKGNVAPLAIALPCRACGTPWT